MKVTIHHRGWVRAVIISAAALIVVVATSVIFFLMNQQGSETPAPPDNANVAPVPEPVAPEPEPAPVPTPLKPDFVIPAATAGLAPVLYRIPTDLPVVYLGIDDGVNKTQAEVDLMKQYNIKASLFLANMFISGNPDFFKAMVASGSVVENHSVSHNVNMSKEPYAYQKAEICGMADKIEQYYGRRPTLFRPPGGAYTDTTRQAAHDCGMKAVVTWIAKANGGAMQYQIGNVLRPGDIVLMHFRAEFQQDLEAFVTAMKAAGLQTELLEDLTGAQ